MRNGAFFLRCALPLTALAVFSGCKRETIEVYRVPKEEEPAPITQQASADPHAGMTAKAARPQVGWKTPTGWEEQPADPQQMRVVSFRIKGTGDEKAEVSVMPFGGMGGTDLDFVNLWRQTIKLPPIDASELAKYSEDITVGDTSGKLFDIYGKDTPADQRPGARIVVAVVKHDGATWFFKLAGDGTLVAKEKPALLEFLKSIDFHPPPGAASTPAVASAEDSSVGGAPRIEVPAGWKQVAPGNMILARYQLSGGGPTDVTVSAFPGDVGGLLANVNRWRSQVGLPAIDQAGLATAVTPLDVSGSKATLVDMTGDKGGQKTRLIGVIVPRGGQTWFYKLLGDEQVAEREKAALIKFVQTVKPDAQ